MAYEAENIYYLPFDRKSLLTSGSVLIKQYDELVILLTIKNKFFIRKNYNFSKLIKTVLKMLVIRRNKLKRNMSLLVLVLWYIFQANYIS